MYYLRSCFGRFTHPIVWMRCTTPPSQLYDYNHRNHDESHRIYLDWSIYCISPTECQCYTFVCRHNFTLSLQRSLEHSPIAFDVNRWASRGGALLLRNLASTLPCRAFQHLSQCQLLRTQTELLADSISYPVPAEMTRSEPDRWTADEPHSSMMVMARHSTIAGCEGGSLGMLEFGSG